MQQVYCVKKDCRKKENSDMNATIEKLVTVVKNLAIDGKIIGKSSIDIFDAKFE